MFKIFITIFYIIVFNIIYSQNVSEGMTIFTPQQQGGGTNTILMDQNENIINSWNHSNGPASMPYLLTDSTIIYPYRVSNPTMNAGGVGGGIQHISWDGNVLWNYTLSNADYQHHHDVHPLPNGNVLVLVWEKKTATEAYAMGRSSINNSLNAMWSEAILELEMVGSNLANVVWEWHLWDHLIQDYDSNLPGYGQISEHPELFNINEGNVGSNGGPGGPNADWMHINAIDYNADLDQIIFSSRKMNEVYIIDHSTTTEEAASHSGGNCDKGGDFLYRWGNPQNYGRGSNVDQLLSAQHSVNWIPSNYPGGGNLILFNNGYSSQSSAVFEWMPPLNGNGCYDDLESNQIFAPSQPLWVHSGGFESGVQSGAFRMYNGNTLITDANSARIFEVDYNGNIVWDYYYSGGSEMIARAQKYPIDYLAGPTYIPGDVNGDEIINVLDVVITVNIILGVADLIEPADYNGDGTVNVLDIVSMVNLILG